jgi:hypothetical protein
VNYQRNSSLAVAGWAISKSNVNPDNLKTFDAINFSGKCLDVVYSPQNAFKWEEDAEKLWDNGGDRLPNRNLKKFSEYGRDFDVEIEGLKIHIKFDINVNYNLYREKRSIGEATPLMQFQFESAQDIKDLPKFYLYAFDLMKFFSFRKNVSFDKIYLSRKITEGESAGKYDKSAEVYFHTNPEALKYNLIERKVVTIEDIGEAFPKLFENICKRRVEGIVDDLYIPLNDSEARTVTYSSFLSAALSFEGEYTRLYPDQQSERDKVFEEIKKDVLEYISEQEKKFVGYSKTEVGKAKKAIKQMKKQIINLESSLEAKFNRARKKYKNILSAFIKEIENQELKGERINNWGECLSNMRNHIGHGNPLLIERKHVAVFRITKCLIYILILRSSGVTEEKTKSIIKKLFE